VQHFGTPADHHSPLPVYFDAIFIRPQFVAVGVHFLIFGHIRTAELFCAVLFMSFSFARIVQASLDFGKERDASVSCSLADTPRFHRRIKLDETETVVLELQESPSSEAITGTPHWPIVNGSLQNHPRFRSLYERLFPAISVRGYAVETVILLASFFCALSGISQGLTGAGGPPRIVAYSVLDVSKGAIRGLTGIVLVSCLSLLYVLDHFH
jgi:hypothetical protein